MKTFKAEYLLNLPEQDLWGVFKGNPTVKVSFYDGDRVMLWRRFVYSWYFWRFHRTYDRLKLSVKHCIDNRPLDDDTDNGTFNRIYRSLYEVYGEANFPKDSVGKITYSVINDLHELTNTRVEEYFTMLSATDVIKLAHYPPIREIIAATEPNRESIEDMYRKLTEIIFTDPSLMYDQLAISIRQGTNNVKQWLELCALRGYITEINDVLFPDPVMTSHLRGTNSPIDRLKDSRTGTKSLASNKIPLEQSEYQGRRLRMLAMNVKGIKSGDCGSRHYVRFPVTKENLKHVEGVWRKTEDGTEAIVWSDQTELIGQTIEIRNPSACLHSDHVCERCYGILHCSVPEGTNIGWSCSMQFSEKISQGTLSLKHLAFNPVAKILRYMLDDKEIHHPLITGKKDPQHFYLRDDFHKRYHVAIPLTDISMMSDFEDIELTEGVDLRGIVSAKSIEFIDTKASIQEEMFESVGSDKCPSQVTPQFVEYARKQGWWNNGKKLLISMENWDLTQPLFRQELRAENNLDMVRRLSWIYEGTSGEKALTKAKAEKLAAVNEGVRVRDAKTRDRALELLYNTVSYKIPLHVSVMGVMLKAVSCVDPDNGDYRISTGNERYIARSLNEKMRNGSCGALFGYQDLRNWAVDRKSFDDKRVDSHPMDVFITGEVTQ